MFYFFYFYFTGFFGPICHRVWSTKKQKKNFFLKTNNSIVEENTHMQWITHITTHSKRASNRDNIKTEIYSIQTILKAQDTVFQGFSKDKSANGGSILSSSQFLILPQLPQKIKLASKVVKVDSKIIILLPKI